MQSIQDMGKAKQVAQANTKTSAITSAIGGVLDTIGSVASIATGNPIPSLVSSGLSTGTRYAGTAINKNRSKTLNI